MRYTFCKLLWLLSILNTFSRFTRQCQISRRISIKPHSTPNVRIGAQHSYILTDCVVLLSRTLYIIHESDQILWRNHCVRIQYSSYGICVTPLEWRYVRSTHCLWSFIHHEIFLTLSMLDCADQIWILKTYIFLLAWPILFKSPSTNTVVILCYKTDKVNNMCDSD